MHRLHAWKFGLAMALTFAVIYTVCAVAVALFPDGTVVYFNNWFHGLDLRLLKPAAERSLTLVQFAYGLVSVAAVSFAGGATLAGFYNVFLGRFGRQ